MIADAVDTFRACGCERGICPRERSRLDGNGGRPDFVSHKSE